MLTEEEYKNLAGNKAKLEAEYQKRLEQSIENFRLALINAISRYNTIDLTHAGYNFELQEFIRAIREAMNNAKLKEPSLPSPDSQPSAADNQ